MSSTEDPPRRTQTNGGSLASCGIKWDPTYVTKQWEGRVKLAEILCTLLAGAVLPYYVYLHGGVFSFFSFVAWTACINAAIDMFLHLTSLWGRLLYICRAPEVFLILCCVACGAFLLASSLVAGYAKYAHDRHAAGAASFFGFASMVLFGIEAYMHFIVYRRGRSENVRQEEPDEFAEPI